ncbi:hypothetical protein BC830DRAFT_1170623 [Chytriomyces sp. MP71]|nr:hypothetical protein BC830DRAFT_1170623 [Chytriomyces sp. MP71]
MVDNSTPTPAQEEGWNAVVLPILCLAISLEFTVQFALERSFPSKPPLNAFQNRILSVLLIWACVRTLGFFFRSALAALPQSLARNDAFVTATRAILAIGGAPLTRVVTKNAVTCLGGVERVRVGWWRCPWWRSWTVRRRFLGRVQAGLDAVLGAGIVLLIVAAIAKKMYAGKGLIGGGWGEVVWRVAAGLFLLLNAVPVVFAVFGFYWAHDVSRVDVFVDATMLRRAFAITLLQSMFLLFKYVYQMIDDLDSSIFNGNEYYFYGLSVLPEFMVTVWFCWRWVLLMFRLEELDGDVSERRLANIQDVSMSMTEFVHELIL